MSNVIINSPISGKDKTAKRAVNDGAAQPLDFGHQQEAKFAHQRGQRIPDGRVEQQRVWVTNPSVEHIEMSQNLCVPPVHVDHQLVGNDTPMEVNVLDEPVEHLCGGI